jgi:hypothetical protein
MNESITRMTNHFSPTASLAAIGVKVRQQGFFGPIRSEVQIRQKTAKHTPADKLSDVWISLLAGAHGQVEITTRLRTDPGEASGERPLGLRRTVGGARNRCQPAPQNM